MSVSSSFRESLHASRAAISPELGWGYQLLGIAALLIDSISLASGSSLPKLGNYLTLAAFTIILFSIRYLGKMGEYLFIAVFLLATVVGYSIPLVSGTLGIYAICAIWFGNKRFIHALALYICAAIAEYAIPQSGETLSHSESLFSVGVWFIAVVGVGAVLLFFNTRVRYLHNLAEEYRIAAEEAEDRVRHQIATDLHDVTARDLSHLALFTQELTESGSAHAKDLARLSELTTEAAGRLRPLILQLDSERESATLAQATGLSTAMLTSRRIRLKSTLPEHVDENLTRQQRLTGSLVIREGATNILKYAPAQTEAELEVGVDSEGNLSLLLSSAFASDSQPAEGTPHISTGGYGLANLKDRVESEGGSITFGPIGARWILQVTLPSFKELLP